MRTLAVIAAGELILVDSVAAYGMAVVLRLNLTHRLVLVLALGLVMMVVSSLLLLACLVPRWRKKGSVRYAALVNILTAAAMFGLILSTWGWEGASRDVWLHLVGAFVAGVFLFTQAGRLFDEPVQASQSLL